MTYPFQLHRCFGFIRVPAATMAVPTPTVPPKFFKVKVKSSANRDQLNCFVFNALGMEGDYTNGMDPSLVSWHAWGKKSVGHWSPTKGGSYEHCNDWDGRAKNVFQLHGVNHQGKPVVKKRLSRSGLVRYMANLPACVVGMEVQPEPPMTKDD